MTVTLSCRRLALERNLFTSTALPPRTMASEQLILEFPWNRDPRQPPTTAYDCITMPALNKKVVLITGANAGIGLNASLNVVKHDNYHLILAGRSAERVHEAAERVRAQAAPSTTVEEVILDLSDLSAIREFTEKLKARDDVKSISTIVCNAGVSGPTKTTTKDGFESIFGVNHLAHFLLVKDLCEMTERAVVVSSETHDPEERTPAPVPNVSDLEQLAFGYEPFIGMEAYTTSKLCNLLMMFEFMRRFPSGPQWLAYTPGYTPDTGLNRHNNLDVAATIAKCKAAGVPVNSGEAAGAFMARIAVENWADNEWNNGDYVRVDSVHKTSKQATDPSLGSALWEKSEELLKRAGIN